jgi:hypothetical protein
MALLIKTTGLEDYAPGGTARVKVLVIGGPGAGKTRWSSYFPKPIFADCEKGRASIADRRMPYVEITSSQDMIDLLTMMKHECRQPKDGRKYETIVIDTLDAFQRKVKNEWMELNRKDVFTGWEAWGYLNSKMQLLMTRLLNLDMHVIVNVHYKDKTVHDDETGRDAKELMLQLQGETADTAFNDFDLVGWMGTFWKPGDDGKRVQKRGLTFKADPKRPFLKDRLHVTPDWLEVNFDGDDYTRLFAPIQAKAETLGASQIVEEVPRAEPERDTSTIVVAPGALGSGPVGTHSFAAAAKDLPLSQMDKPTLVKMARDLGVTAGPNGPLAGNSTKAEYVEALEAHRDGKTPAPAAPARPEPAPADPVPEPAKVTGEPARPAAAKPAVAKTAANPRRTKAKIQSTEAGLVDVSTGEIHDEPKDQTEQAIQTVKDTLGGVVIEDSNDDSHDDQAEKSSEQAQHEADKAVVLKPEPAEAKKPAPIQATCEICGKSLAGERPDIVKIAFIRFRKRVCEADYDQLKSKR